MPAACAPGCLCATPTTARRARSARPFPRSYRGWRVVGRAGRADRSRCTPPARCRRRWRWWRRSAGTRCARSGGGAVVAAIVGNQLRSIGWTAVLIAAMLLAALRSLRWTMVVMAPVLGATLLLFAGLGYAGVPLGIATSMFAALNLGAGVDFAVQYVYAYRRERRAGLPHAAAGAATLRTTRRRPRWHAHALGG